MFALKVLGSTLKSLLHCRHPKANSSLALGATIAFGSESDQKLSLFTKK